MCDNLLDNDIILIELPRDPNNVPWEVPDNNLYLYIDKTVIRHSEIYLSKGPHNSSFNNSAYTI